MPAAMVGAQAPPDREDEDDEVVEDEPDEDGVLSGSASETDILDSGTPTVEFTPRPAQPDRPRSRLVPVAAFSRSPHRKSAGRE